MEVFGLSTDRVLEAITGGSEPKFADASKVYNTMQQYKKALIIDFRAPEAFQKAHFAFSINVPHYSVTPDEFLDYDPAKFMEKHFANTSEKELFTHRRRLMVFLIPSHGSVKHLCENPSVVQGELSLDPAKYKNRVLRAKGFSLSVLCYKAFTKEKVREVYILKEGFRELSGRFPFLCEFCGTNKIYLEPFVFSVTYP